MLPRFYRELYIKRKYIFTLDRIGAASQMTRIMTTEPTNKSTGSRHKDMGAFKAIPYVKEFYHGASVKFVSDI